MVINEEEYDETVRAMDEMEGFISENNPENEYHKVVLEVKLFGHIKDGLMLKKDCFLVIRLYFFILRQTILSLIRCIRNIHILPMSIRFCRRGCGTAQERRAINMIKKEILL